MTLSHLRSGYDWFIVLHHCCLFCFFCQVSYCCVEEMVSDRAMYKYDSGVRLSRTMIKNTAHDVNEQVSPWEIINTQDICWPSSRFCVPLWCDILFLLPTGKAYCWWDCLSHVGTTCTINAECVEQWLRIKEEIEKIGASLHETQEQFLTPTHTLNDHLWDQLLLHCCPTGVEF